MHELMVDWEADHLHAEVHALYIVSNSEKLADKPSPIKYPNIAMPVLNLPVHVNTLTDIFG